MQLFASYQLLLIAEQHKQHQHEQKRDLTFRDPMFAICRVHDDHPNFSGKSYGVKFHLGGLPEPKSPGDLDTGSLSRRNEGTIVRNVGKRFLNRPETEWISAHRLPKSTSIVRLEITSDRQASWRHAIVAIQVAGKPAYVSRRNWQPEGRLTLIGVRIPNSILSKGNGRSPHHQSAQ